MIQVYEKNGLFIIEDTCIDVIYPNLTRDEAVEKLKKHRRDADRVDYPITDMKEDEFKYDSLEASIEYVKYIEQQLAEKDREIEILNDRLDKYISGRLKSMLDEKDKEIEALNKTIFRLSNEKERANNIQNIDYLSFAAQIRKQVCDEIKEKLKAHCDYTDEEHIGWYISEEKIDIILNQIEKGEEV